MPAGGSLDGEDLKDRQDYEYLSGVLQWPQNPTAHGYGVVGESDSACYSLLPVCRGDNCGMPFRFRAVGTSVVFDQAIPEVVKSCR